MEGGLILPVYFAPSSSLDWVRAILSGRTVLRSGRLQKLAHSLVLKVVRTGLRFGSDGEWQLWA